MDLNRKNLWFGLGAIAIGSMVLILFMFDIREGALHGSASDGLTKAETPLAFYASVGLKFILAAFLLIVGAYSLRQKS